MTESVLVSDAFTGVLKVRSKGRSCAYERQRCDIEDAVVLHQRRKRNHALVVIHGKRNVECVAHILSEEFLGRIGAVSFDAFLFRLSDGRDEHFLLFRSVRVGIESQDGNSRVGDTEVALHAVVQLAHFVEDVVDGNVSRDVLDGKSVGSESYAYRLVYHHLHTLGALSDACFGIAFQSLVAIVVGIHGLCVGRTGYQYVEMLTSEVGHGLVESLECCVARLLCRRTKLHLHFSVKACQHVYASVLCVRSIVDDAEVGLQVHSLAMVCCYFGGAIYNRCA